MKILHITDLHITDPQSDNEALREAFYPEYLAGLAEEINQHGVDKIFITGDIVDRSKTQNYPHALQLIQFLSDKINVEPKDIFVINGNHDVPRDTGDLDEFNSFSHLFNSSKDLIDSGGRSKLFSIENGNAILCIDSIGINFKSGLPCALSTTEIDTIVTTVRKKDINHLFILSHHPAASYDAQAQAPFDESADWSKEHIWPHGGNLFRRLSSRETINGTAYWFSGDVHRQEHTLIGQSQVLVVTGSCNAFENMTTSIQPQVRVISPLNSENSQLIEYNFVGHHRKGLEGNWISRTVSPMKITPPKSENESKSKAPIKEKDSILVNGPAVMPPRKLNCLDQKLGKETYTKVNEKNLYKFGRFDTCESTTALSWVSIAPLLDSQAMYKKVINCYKNKINEIIDQIQNKNECIIVGVDHWGAILAARLGTAINIRSCCVAVRGQLGSYDNHEIINDRLHQIIKGKKFVFVISDVISTGNSMSKVIQELKIDGTNWYGFSIICDPAQNRESRLDNYNEVFYICGSLKMPIISTELMPSKGVLNTDISFIESN